MNAGQEKSTGQEPAQTPKKARRKRDAHRDPDGNIVDGRRAFRGVRVRQGKTANRMVVTLPPFVRYAVCNLAKKRGVTMSSETAALVAEGLRARGYDMDKILVEWLAYQRQCAETGEENLFPDKRLGGLYDAG